MKLDILSDTNMTYSGSSFLSGVSLPAVSKSFPGTTTGYVNAKVAQNRKELHESLERIGRDYPTPNPDGLSTRKSKKDVKDSMLAYTEHARGIQRERHTPRYAANTLKRMFPR